MAKRISHRRRKLVPRRALAFMVSAGSAGSVELTLYAGRRSLSRDRRCCINRCTSSCTLAE